MSQHDNTTNAKTSAASIERNANLITAINYADGSTGDFHYDNGRLVRARVGDYYYEKSRPGKVWELITRFTSKFNVRCGSNGWMETLDGYGSDYQLAGMPDSVELVQKDTERFAAGTLVIRGGHFFGVIGPEFGFYIGLNENGKVHSVSYPNKTTVMLEYGENGKLCTVIGPSASGFRMDPICDASHKLIYTDALGKQIPHLSLNPDDDKWGLSAGNARQLSVASDWQSPLFGTIEAEGFWGHGWSEHYNHLSYRWHDSQGRKVS